MHRVSKPSLWEKTLIYQRPILPYYSKASSEYFTSMDEYTCLHSGITLSQSSPFVKASEELSAITRSHPP